MLVERSLHLTDDDGVLGDFLGVLPLALEELDLEISLQELQLVCSLGLLPCALGRGQGGRDLLFHLHV